MKLFELILGVIIIFINIIVIVDNRCPYWFAGITGFVGGLFFVSIFKNHKKGS